MIAGMVVPLGWRNIASTAFCLEGEAAGVFDAAAFEAAAFDAVGFDRVVALLLAGRFAARVDLRALFEGFDFGLLLAIWLSVVRVTASGAATAAKPRRI